MELKNFGALIAGFIVAALLVSAILVPVIDTTTTTADTFENDGYFHLKKYTAEDDVTFTWDYTNPTSFTINEETMEYTNESALTQSVILGQRFAARLATNNTGLTFYGAGTYINANATTPTFTLSYSGGSITATNGTTTKPIADVSEIYVIATEGDYVMKVADSVAYLNSGSEIVADSEIYASGQTFNGGANIFWHLQGTIDNMEYPDTFDSNLTITNEEIHGEHVADHKNLYALNNITFTATTLGGTVYNITASYFVVPAEVTAERSQHLNSTEISLLGIVPLLVTVGILLGIVGVIFTRRE